MIFSTENLPIISDLDFERWYFDSYSRGYHAKEKGNEYDSHAVAITRNNVLLDVWPKVNLIIFGNFFLCLRHQFALWS